MGLVASQQQAGRDLIVFPPPSVRQRLFFIRARMLLPHLQPHEHNDGLVNICSNSKNSGIETAYSATLG